jgi:cytochrome P450
MATGLSTKIVRMARDDGGMPPLAATFGDGAATDRPLIPPAPAPVTTTASTRALLALYRTNALRAWPERAYDADTVERPFFGRQSLLLNHPDDIRRVLVDNPGAYGRTRATRRIIRPLLGDGLFLAEGQEWRDQRRRTAPAFTPAAVPMFARVAAAVSGETLDALPVGDPVELLAVFQALALTVASRAMFSLDPGAQGGRLRWMILEYGQRYGRPGFFDFVLPMGLPSPRDLGRWRFKRRWMREVETLIDRRRQHGPASNDADPDLFERLAANSDGDAQGLRDQVATLLVAGHETTAVALFWACVLLALAPDWQERMASEADGLDLSAGGGADALDRLVLTRAVVHEAMRLYPPAFVIVREALSADRLTESVVQKGAVVMIAPWVLHRHRRLWRDPAAFDPGRFHPDAPPPPRYAYLPFGAGPRVCVGASLAITEATVVLAALVRRFRIECAGPEPVMPTAVITTQPDRPVRFRLHRRD